MWITSGSEFQKSLHLYRRPITTVNHWAVIPGDCVEIRENDNGIVCLWLSLTVWCFGWFIPCCHDGCANMAIISPARNCYWLFPYFHKLNKLAEIIKIIPIISQYCADVQLTGHASQWAGLSQQNKKCHSPRWKSVVCWLFVVMSSGSGRCEFFLNCTTAVSERTDSHTLLNGDVFLYGTV